MDRLGSFSSCFSVHPAYRVYREGVFRTERHHFSDARAEQGSGPDGHEASTSGQSPNEPRQDGLKNTFTNLDAHPAACCLRRQTFEKV